MTPPLSAERRAEIEAYYKPGRAAYIAGPMILDLLAEIDRLNGEVAADHAAMDKVVAAMMPSPEVLDELAEDYSERERLTAERASLRQDNANLREKIEAAKRLLDGDMSSIVTMRLKQQEALRILG